MKKYKKLYITTVLFYLYVFLTPYVLKAQNEPYHGGIGDGSSTFQSTSINFGDVNDEGTSALRVNIDLAASQENNETENLPINYTVVFNGAVSDFSEEDITLKGTAIPTSVTVTGSGTTYNVQITETQMNGTVIIDIPIGAAHNSFANPNATPVIIDNEVTYIGHNLIPEITLSDYQNSPTNSKIVNFKITFSDIVTDFVSSDIELLGTANPTDISISQSNSNTYIAEVTGMSTNGTVIINIPPNKVTNIYGKKNITSKNTNNTISCDFTAPTVTINLSEGQVDPAYTLPIKFQIIFSEEINFFSEENIAFGGSENLTLAVTGVGRVYEASINGAITNETVSISIPFGITYDNALNPNEKSENIKNSVTFLGTTSINNIKNDILNKIYFDNENLIVDLKKIPNKNSYIKIINIKGQQVFENPILNKRNVFPLHLSDKMLIIKLYVNGQMINKKIIAN